MHFATRERWGGGGEEVGRGVVGGEGGGLKGKSIERAKEKANAVLEILEMLVFIMIIVQEYRHGDGWEE